MRSVARKLRVASDEKASFLDMEVFVGIGNLTFEQLSNLRHRGAFSTVSLTFVQCCQLTQHKLFMEQWPAASPLESWYQVWRNNPHSKYMC